jgi:hypothetical protein
MTFFYSENFSEIKLDVLEHPEKSIKEIEIITENNESLKFPLQKRLASTIFFDGVNFMRHEKNSNHNDWNNNSEYRAIWKNDLGTDDYYDESGMRRDDEYNPENWQGHDG